MCLRRVAAARPASSVGTPAAVRRRCSVARVVAAGAESSAAAGGAAAGSSGGSLNGGHADVSRRACISFLTASAAALLQPARPAQANSPLTPLPPHSPDIGLIYSEYPYSSPQDVLKFVRDRAPVNNPQAVLDAIDEFSAAYPMFKIGPDKGMVLDRLVSMVQPQLVVELGSFIGYSAVRIARLLPPGGRLVCVEANAECVEAMQGVLEHAGLQDRVVVEAGLAEEVVPVLKERYGAAQLLFEDHCKPCYYPDLLLAEASGLVGPGTWLFADNVIYPGTPDLLVHLRNLDEYATVVVPALYEYDQPWNPSWEPKEDGMAISVRLAGLGQEQSAEAKAQVQRFLKL